MTSSSDISELNACFPVDVETAYEDGWSAEKRRVETHANGRRRGTSFLDLPGELRNVIYELVLRRPRYVRMGFKYDFDVSDG